MLPAGKFPKFSELLERQSETFLLDFPNGKFVYHLRFSPVPSPSPIFMRITCHLVGVVQMVHANPDRNFSLPFVQTFYQPVFPCKW